MLLHYKIITDSTNVDLITNFSINTVHNTLLEVSTVFCTNHYIKKNNLINNNNNCDNNIKFDDVFTTYRMYVMCYIETKILNVLWL